ncbi:hypothetical protein NBRC10512_004396 [Rhodotorula toruloides]|uniref:RHTO0S15e03796g1_1 n=2 Tax=Rhodotorula toruloides TaxID=5286 RepID=A0A061BDA0_RHOTO|nr:glycosyltransferase family 31 protein [Rhodotorula toruloides NP11]EMS25409.1 glycosyltransferase family 31 protein [Rhodotorula toruloides NP11]KAJ8295576.1 hypothetical protein OF846_001787 [Rhodotorula toruloides]CDR47926.1 RHTO0S15e03796g1_1 [Rhodotorula toruloides]
MLEKVLPAERPLFLGKERRPSAEPLLPHLSSAHAASVVAPSRPGRWTKALAVVLLLYGVATLGTSPGRPFGWMASRRGAQACEADGLASPTVPRRDDQHRIVVRVRPASADEPRLRNPDNTVLPQAFHPRLAAENARLFSRHSSALPLASGHPKNCITPASHSLPILPKVESSAQDPEIFFSISTSPARAVKYAPVWRHFMLAPRPTTPALDDISGRLRSPTAPGCVVTDAQGANDGRGQAMANAEFRRQGLSCTMRDSSRVGERYEMRVLGLVKDVWQESERRRWQDGASLVEWFVFGDDDTWWTDPVMLRQLLAGYDSREELILGTFSETRGNFDMFGRIAFGGGGIVISRSLVRKMQGMLDKCAERFAHIFGGDGLISECAAWTRNVPLDQLVEEVPAMRQMDIRGDATGYLTAGTAPFLSLHHWSSWLDVFPGIDAFRAIDILSSAASAVGGPNFLRRWIFDEGRVTWTVGHSITVHREALTPEDLTRIEWTWSEHPPRREPRRALAEGEEKLTYYLTSVERLSSDLTIFKHTCSHPSVQAGLREIDVMWDTRSESPTWQDRWLPGWNAGTDVASGRLFEKAKRRVEYAA